MDVVETKAICLQSFVSFVIH